jgi:hypothetical protein
MYSTGKDYILKESSVTTVGLSLRPHAFFSTFNEFQGSIDQQLPTEGFCGTALNPPMEVGSEQVAYCGTGQSSFPSDKLSLSFKHSIQGNHPYL